MDHNVLSLINNLVTAGIDYECKGPGEVAEKRDLNVPGMMEEQKREEEMMAGKGKDVWRAENNREEKKKGNVSGFYCYNKTP